MTVNVHHPQTVEENQLDILQQATADGNQPDTPHSPPVDDKVSFHCHLLPSLHQSPSNVLSNPVRSTTDHPFGTNCLLPVRTKDNARVTFLTVPEEKSPVFNETKGRVSRSRPMSNPSRRFLERISQQSKERRGHE